MVDATACRTALRDEKSTALPLSNDYAWIGKLRIRLA